MRAADPAAVAAALAVRTALPANWRDGLAAAAVQGVFVAPPVRGWVAVTGADLWRAVAADRERLAAVLAALSQQFGEAQWFAADLAGERFGWARARRGAVERGYAFAGEQGPVWDDGEPGAAERALGCFVADPRDQSDDPVKWWPDLRVVRGIAAAWSFDPASLAAADAPPAAGLLGRL